MSTAAAPHVSPVRTYLAVYGALLVLTVATVAVSYLGLPSLASVAVAMGIATAKASLVVLFFMHMKWDVPFNRFVFGAALWFLAIFFIFTMVDLASRGLVLQVQDNFEYRAEHAAAE